MSGRGRAGGRPGGRNTNGPCVAFDWTGPCLEGKATHGQEGVEVTQQREHGGSSNGRRHNGARGQGGGRHGQRSIDSIASSNQSFAGQAEDKQQQDQHKRKQSSFLVGDSCFTNIDGAIRAGTIMQVPTRQSRGQLYKIQLNKDQDNDTEDHQDVIVAEVGRNLYHPDDKVPPLKKQDKRTQATISPWRTSRAKKYYIERLLDENDSIHNKSDDDVYNMSFYDNGEPVVNTKYSLSDFKKNYNKLKVKSSGQVAAAAEDEAALKRDSKLYPRPELDFHGNPYYAQSTLRAKLIADVKSGAAGRGKKPRDILASHHEYQPLQNVPKTFRNYRSRELRKESESTGWQIQRNRKGYKQHEQDHIEARKPPK